MPERRLVFLHASDYCAGAERSLCDMASGLQSRGLRVEVWNAGDNPELASWLAERGIPLQELPAPEYGSRDLRGFLKQSLVLAARWLFHRPALVHANSITATKYAAPVAALLRVPLVGHVRDEPELDGLTRRLLGRASLVLAISEFIAEALGPLPGTRVEVLHNAIDVQAIEPAVPEADASQPLRIVIPAAFRRNKRLNLALDCAARLQELGLDLRWRICGPRPFPEVEAELLEQHEGLGLEQVVELGPALPHEKLYRDAHLVVSTAAGEPFGRTVIEAYARGLPVVGFDSGALPEIVEQGETGLLVPDGDVDALTAAIAGLAADRERVAAMGRAGRALAESRFSYEPYLDALEALHDSVA